MVDDRPTYRVLVEREDQLWTAAVRGFEPGTFGATDTDRFAELDEMVRDLVVTVTDADPEAFDLVWSYVQQGVDYTVELEHARDAATRLRAAESERDAARSAAAEAMARAGLSQRAIGDALGVSHQRVGQILTGRGERRAVTGRRAG